MIRAVALGVTEVPMEYGQHRYLTKDAASTFLNPDYQMQEATEFAGRTFKRVMYYTCSAPDQLLAPVTRLLTGFEGETRDDLGWVEPTALAMIEADDREAARKLLTYYATSRAMDALKLGDDMAQGLDAYTRLVTGQKRPEGDDINATGPTVNCVAGGDPDVPSE